MLCQISGLTIGNVPNLIVWSWKSARAIRFSIKVMSLSAGKVPIDSSFLFSLMVTNVDRRSMSLPYVINTFSPLSSLSFNTLSVPGQ